MRYAMVSETYPPEINGVALTVQDLERGLRARGHEVDVVRPRQWARETPAAHEALAAGLPIPRYPGMRFGLPSPLLLRRQWARRRPDAVYVATEGPLGWSALRTALRLGIPVATGFHTRFDQYTRDYGLGMLEPLAMRWMRRFHNASDATLVPTCELRDFLDGNGFSGVVHLPRAVDCARFDPVRRDPALRAEWGCDDGQLAVLYFGRVAAEKNLALAIRAFEAVRARRPDARFVWVGEGPELASVRAAHPDYVYRGLRLGTDLARHVASADLFLFPSHSETFGNVTLEAMASGVATVAFRYGAAREHLRHGVHGAAIEGGNEDAFVDAACALASDDADRRRMGRQAREALRKLRPEQVAADFEAVLIAMVARHGRSGDSVDGWTRAHRSEDDADAAVA